ncbi:MAG TPA: hypothetical protein VHO43_04115 [Ignavibacteriales bacterium]|nr:hypothetical protein [Ignavibacteriales bacterium]
MNSKRALALAFLTAAFLIFGCESPIEQAAEAEEMSITGLLRAGSDEPQMISVFKTSPLGDQNQKDNFISDAEVYLTDSLGYSSRYVLTDNISYGKGYKSPGKTDFVPGRKYYLSVETPFGKAQGETRFPGDFEITSHKNSDTIMVPEDKTVNIELSWTKSEGAYGYVVYDGSTRIIESSDGNSRNNYGGGRVFATVDNRIVLPVYKSAYGKGRIIKSEELITITAYDNNFRAHHYESNNSAGVKGAYGYFASAVSKTIKLVIK